MQVRAGRAAGGADRGDALAGQHDGADSDEELGRMPIARDEAVAVVDLDRPAIGAARTGEAHRSPALARIGAPRGAATSSPV